MIDSRARDADGDTRLRTAVRLGHHQVLNRPVKCDCCLASLKDGNGETPFHYVVRRGDVLAGTRIGTLTPQAAAVASLNGTIAIDRDLTLLEFLGRAVFVC